MPLRLIFMGTPDFAVPTLLELVAHGHEIAAVYTRAAKPAGRGMKLQPTPVEQEARRLDIPVLTPTTLKTSEALEAFRAHQADAAVVVAYGMILPKTILDAPKLGCFNLHASLLPRWRGAAPIHRAIQAGDPETGVTIMQMDAGLDTGDMLLVEKCPIDARDTTATLHDKLAPLGGHMMVRALELAGSGKLQPVKQPDEGVTYAHKIEKAEAAVDWTQPVAVIDRHIRAMTPFPGATAQLGLDTIKLCNSEIDSSSRPMDVRCGHILSANADGVRVAGGDGVLTLTELQRAGGKRLSAADFLRGFALQAGQAFELPRP